MAMLNNQRVSLSLCVAVWPCPSGESLEVGDLANCSSFCSFVALDVETPLRDVLHLIAGRHRKKRQGQVGITGKNMDQILFNVESLLFPWFSWLMKRLIQLLETNLHVCSFWRWNGETVKPTFFVGKIHVVLIGFVGEIARDHVFCRVKTHVGLWSESPCLPIFVCPTSAFFWVK